MANLEREIAEKIEDGSYYQDARDWYAWHYLYPITERVWFSIIAIIVISTLGMMCMYIYSLDVRSRIQPFPIMVDNSTDYFSHMKHIANPDDTTQEAVARYLVTAYLKTREEYSPSGTSGDKLKYNLRKIKSASSKKVLNEYKNYISDLNPYSPITRYQDHITRTVAIKSFDFIGSDFTAGKARVLFEATETDKNTSESKKTMWEATVHFRIPDIETIAQTGAPLRFLVKYYKAQPKE